MIVFSLFGKVAPLVAQLYEEDTDLYWASNSDDDPNWEMGYASPENSMWGAAYPPIPGADAMRRPNKFLPNGISAAWHTGSPAIWAEDYSAGGVFPETSYWTAQPLPKGTLYPAYLSGRKESRLQSIFTHDSDYGWLWDITLGGRVPLFRYGTEDPVAPEGFQIDVEGAALLRLDFERSRNLAATDYRAGLPITYGTKHWQFKTGYYHVSSHLGDNYLLDNFRQRVHYVRDEIFLGIAFKPFAAFRLYGEAGWAFHTGETTSPWEFQVGAEFSPAFTPERAWRGAPFVAVHGHLFQELDYGGYVNSQAGWQWRKSDNGVLRIGAEFYCGCDDQYQFHSTHQKKVGGGVWYDF
ncbi:MAG: DUF1207 domain-containing protein [Thermoguttaceae bacterium]